MVATIPPETHRAERAARPSSPTPLPDLDFPGCDPVPLPTWDDVVAYEGRIE